MVCVFQLGLTQGYKVHLLVRIMRDIVVLSTCENKTRHTLLKLRSCFLEDILMHIKRPKSSLHVPAPLTVWKICLLGSQIHHGHFHDRYRQKCLAKTLPTRYCSTSVDDPFWRNSYPLLSRYKIRKPCKC